MELEDTGINKEDLLEEKYSPHCENHLNQYFDILAQNLIIPRNKISSCLVSGSGAGTYIPIDERAIIEARCNGVLNIFYAIVPDQLIQEIKKDELVVINCEDTTEIASVKEIGTFVKAKRQRLGLYGEHLPKIIKKVDDSDISILKKNKLDEERAKESFRVKALKYNLQMKLVKVHYQFDRNKLFFFYTADGRIDFRELAKDLASEFRTRIELRQIGVRDEAKKVGGMGTCGREFCCSSFLGNFKRITTQLATEQNLASNFSKLSGPCCKLKCCLSFEVEHLCQCNS